MQTQNLRRVAGGARLLDKTMCTRRRTAMCHTSEFRQMAEPKTTQRSLDVALGIRVISTRSSSGKIVEVPFPPTNTPSTLISRNPKLQGFGSSGLRVSSHPGHAPYMQVSRPHISAAITGPGFGSFCLRVLLDDRVTGILQQNQSDLGTKAPLFFRPGSISSGQFKP